MREIAIRDDTIRLGQLLKLAGLVASGAEAKMLLGEATITVNDTPEDRRGRQLHPGDVVTVDGQPLRIVARAAP